ncbi:hypothetical protein ACROYT_G040149 [Oculina patagonica]
MSCCRKSKRPKPEEPLELAVNLEQQSGSLLEGSASPDENGQRPKENEKKRNEKHLLKTIENGNFEQIEEEIKPRSLTNCESSSLLMGMKVSFQLRRLAEKKGADEERFNQLANTAEAFTYCLLDPLRSNKELHEEFGVYVLDHIIDDAIDLDQKKGPNYINSVPSALARTGSCGEGKQDPPSFYQWLSLNFGDKPAPDIALLLISTLAKVLQTEFPETAKELEGHVYVDVVCGSRTISAKVKQIANDIDAIFEKGHLHIKMRHIDHPDIDQSNKERFMTLLGLRWEKLAHKIFPFNNSEPAGQ